MWLLVPVGALMAGAATFPLGVTTAVITGVVVGAGVLLALAWAPPEIRVAAEGLYAGKAFLEAEHIGTVEPLEREATRAALGPELRADAWLLHRSWVHEAVRVEVNDEADTTPYWVVSTRRPVELADALVACREAAGREGQAAHSEQTG